MKLTFENTKAFKKTKFTNESAVLSEMFNKK